MSIYNIQNQTTSHLTEATWSTGNDRNSIKSKPRLGIPDYTKCSFDITLSGVLVPLNECRLETEALHGAQPSEDVMINNQIVVK